jgi:hypothetical protein
MNQCELTRRFGKLGPSTIMPSNLVNLNFDILLLSASLCHLATAHNLSQHQPSATEYKHRFVLDELKSHLADPSDSSESSQNASPIRRWCPRRPPSSLAAHGTRQGASTSPAEPSHVDDGGAASWTECGCSSCGCDEPGTRAFWADG